MELKKVKMPTILPDLENSETIDELIGNGGRIQRKQYIEKKTSWIISVDNDWSLSYFMAILNEPGSMEHRKKRILFWAKGQANMGP